MSLSWNLEDIENYKDVCWIETDEKNEDDSPVVRFNPVTETIILMSMHTGITRITEANEAEAFARFDLIQRLFSGLLVDGKGKTRFITPVEFHAHVGLSTNALSYTTAQFFSHVRNDIFKGTISDYNREMKRSVERAAV